MVRVTKHRMARLKELKKFGKNHLIQLTKDEILLFAKREGIKEDSLQRDIQFIMEGKLKTATVGGIEEVQAKEKARKKRMMLVEKMLKKRSPLQKATSGRDLKCGELSAEVKATDAVRIIKRGGTVTVNNKKIKNPGIILAVTADELGLTMKEFRKYLDLSGILPRWKLDEIRSRKTISRAHSITKTEPTNVEPKFMQRMREIREQKLAERKAKEAKKKEKDSAREG